MEEEIQSGFISVDEDNTKDEDNGNIIEHENEEVRYVENKIDEPKKGMEFDSIEELMTCYTRYAKEKGFAVSIRSSKKVGGVVKYVTIECTRAGKTKIRSSNLLKMKPNSKIDCKAKLCAVLLADEKWCVTAVELAHNHEMSPGKVRFYKCNRLLHPHVKRRLELNDKAGIRMNKSFNTFVVEAGGNENLSFLEKDCRNFIEKVRRLQLGEGDANAMHNYFLKMQADNSDFFYMMDLDEKGRLKNVFWADARSRAAFKEFGDVITFDTTYLVNKYDMPFAPFVGVNHHGQSVLLGCGLISNEDTETFIWLFQSWITCMSGALPSAIITDQDKAMKKAIEIVFPNVRHRWCLWHIMKKMPEKLKGYKEYESIKWSMQNVVYDSLTKEEFEDAWDKFIEKYQIQSNKWLLGLYKERHRWVPAFVKDIFWAGMSTTQRSESMNAFFDGYVTSKTSLKQFVGQYENALRKKVENEKQEDFNSYNSCYPLVTPFEMEKKFQSVYTRTKFKEFQNEIFGKIRCSVTLSKEDLGFTEYEVRERIPVGEGHRSATFKLMFNEDSKEVNCNCQLFEFRGIICRHQLMVYNEKDIYDEVPKKYILERWSKNVNRRHTKIRISYDNWSDRPEACRFDKMVNAFIEVANVAADSVHWYEDVMAYILVMKAGFKEKAEICGSNRPLSTGIHSDSTSHGDDIVISKESINILDPMDVHPKGRLPCKRKVGNVEKAVKKKREVNTKKKKEAHTKEATPCMGFAAYGTQESINLNGSQMQESPYVPGVSPHIQHPYMPMMSTYIQHPYMPVMSQHIQRPSMQLGGNYSRFQSNMIGELYGTHSQGDQHPVWRVGYDLASMNPSNSTRGLGPEETSQREFHYDAGD